MRRRRLVSAVALGLLAAGVAWSDPPADADEPVIERRAFLYQKLDEGRVLPHLWLALADDPIAESRRLAVLVLASVADPVHLRLLWEFVDDGDPRVRQLVMVAAGRIGPTALGLARVGLSDGSPLVRQAAAWAACHGGAEGLELATRALAREEDPAVLETWLGHLWRVGDGGWRDLVRRWAEHPRPELRRAAAAGLARGGFDPGLVALARDDEPVIRATAIAGFGRGDWNPVAQTTVAGALRDSSPRVRTAALLVLAQRPEAKLSSADAEQLRAALAVAAPHLRVAAVQAAGAHPESLPVGRLLELTASPQSWLAAEALVAAARREPAAALATVRAWLEPDRPDWQRRAAARSAPLMPATEDDVFVTALGDADQAVRLAAVTAIPKDLSASRRARLGQAVRSDPDPMVRAAAVEHVVGTTSLETPAKLLELVHSWRADAVPDARAAAWREALAMTDAADRPRLVEQAMDDPDPGFRALAAVVARGAGMEVSLPPRRARHPPAWYRELATWVERPRWLDVETVRGDFRIRLDPEEAPITSREISDRAGGGGYDGLTLHRVVPNFVVQGGDPRGDGWGGPGYTLRDEPSMKPFDSWRVGVATAGRHTGGCQLFVMLLPADHLTGHYTNLGEVAAGREVPDRLQVGDRILGVTPHAGPGLPELVPMPVGEVDLTELRALAAWPDEVAADGADDPLHSELAEQLAGRRVVILLAAWRQEDLERTARLVRILESLDPPAPLRFVAVDRTRVLGPAHGPWPSSRRVPTTPRVLVLDGEGAVVRDVVATTDRSLAEGLAGSDEEDGER